MSFILNMTPFSLDSWIDESPKSRPVNLLAISSLDGLLSLYSISKILPPVKSIPCFSPKIKIIAKHTDSKTAEKIKYIKRYFVYLICIIKNYPSPIYLCAYHAYMPVPCVPTRKAHKAHTQRTT